MYDTSKLDTPLKEYLENLLHMPYNAKDMEEVYNLGKKILFQELMKYKVARHDGRTLHTMIDYEKAYKELNLCDLE
jgi:hypothetical protein